MQVAVCIPTLERFSYLENNIPRYLNMHIVDQVVLSDETGTDIAQINAKHPEWASHPKLVMRINPGRHGAYHNKQAVVGFARPGWIALIDSDNFASDEDYFQPWMEYVGTNANKDFIYMPGFSTSPETGRIMDFRTFNRIDRTNLGSAVTSFYSASLLVNNGNFIVHTQTYLKPCTVPTLQKMIKSEDVLVVDAAAKMIGMLACGATVQIVSTMTYQHAQHDNSLWAQYSKSPMRTQQSLDLHMLCSRIENTFQHLSKTPLPKPDPNSPLQQYIKRRS
jgi:hypothetical protein